MERKPGIEEQIDSVIGSAKKVNPVDVPVGFTDRAIQRLQEQRGKDASIMPALLKIAAILIIAVVNVYTIERIVNNPAQQAQEISAPATVNDLVSDYQVNDMNDELITPNTVQHE